MNDFLRLLCIVFIFNMGRASLGQAAESALEFDVAFDKTTYPPRAPLFLLIGVRNKSPDPIDVFYAGEWPPPWEKGLLAVQEFDFTSILQGIHYTLNDSVNDLTFEWPERPASALLLDPRAVTQERLVRLGPNETRQWRIRLCIQIAPSQYRVSCKVPALKYKIRGAETVVEFKKDLSVRIVSETETMAGLSGGVSLALKKDAAGAEEPVLNWKLSPPEEWNLPQPAVQGKNCRMRIKDHAGRIISEVFWRPGGGEVIPCKTWTEPLEWQVSAVEMSSANQLLHAAAGKYVLEASFRVYFRREVAKGEQEAGDWRPEGLGLLPPETDHGNNLSPYYISQFERSELFSMLSDDQKQIVKELTADKRIDPMESGKGRWIAFRKEFEVELIDGKLRAAKK